MANEIIVAPTNSNVTLLGNVSAVSVEFVKQALDHSKAFQEIAILILYLLQTPSERAHRNATVRNNMGWSMQHAKYGPYYAEWIAYKLDDGARLGECVSGTIESGKLKGTSRRVGMKNCLIGYSAQIHAFLGSFNGDIVTTTIQAIGKERWEQMVERGRIADKKNANVVQGYIE